MQLLLRIYALKQLLSDSSVLYETGFFRQGSSDLLNEAMQASLRELRPQMVPLVEVRSDLMDRSHMSCIGNQYGDKYETQLEWAMGSKMNQDPVPQFWESHMKPIYHGKL